MDRKVFFPENVLHELELSLKAQQENGSDRNRMKMLRLEKELTEMNEAIQEIPRNFEEIFTFMKGNWPKPGSALEYIWEAYGDDLLEDMKRFGDITNLNEVREVDPQVTVFRIIELHSRVLALKERLTTHLREEKE